jgi:hypothetical protein
VPRCGGGAKAGGAGLGCVAKRAGLVKVTQHLNVNLRLIVLFFAPVGR